MAARATWRVIQVSLVNIPIRVFPATDSAASVSFNSSTPSARPASSEEMVPALRARVPNSELVKATSSRRARYVVVSEEDIEKSVGLTRVIDLQQFAEREARPISTSSGPTNWPRHASRADASPSSAKHGGEGRHRQGRLYGREYLVRSRRARRVS